MAVPQSTYDQLSAITERYYVPALVDNIFDSNPLLQRAKSKGWYKTTGSGTQAIVPLAYATTTSSGWFEGSETLATADNDQFAPLVFDWRQMYASISITGRDENINKGKEQLVNLVSSKVQMAETTMSDTLGTGLYNAGTTANQIVGLRLAVSDAGTYGGVSRTAQTWLASQEDSSTTALSIAAMQAIDTACSIDNDSPTVITTTRTLFNSYYGLLQPAQRFGDEKTASGGFSNLLFNTKPVIHDSHCTANHMFFLNEKYLRIEAFKNSNFTFVPFRKPTNQDVSVAQILLMLAFWTNNCRMQGKLDAVTS